MNTGILRTGLTPDFIRAAQASPQWRTVVREVPGGDPMAVLMRRFARYTGETEIVLDINGETLRYHGNDITPVEPELQPSSLKFTITGATVSCEYDALLYRASTIEALIDPPADEDRLLSEWNATGADYPRDLSLNQLLEQSAARTPGAIAVQFRNQTLTYADLDAASNRLAHCLASKGAKPGAIVGIALDRSLEMLVAVQAVLKTGAAYLPLDPAFPASRLEFMAADANVILQITPETIAESAHFPKTPLGVVIDSGSLAYVLYTSGSTGKPKGVEVSHRAVVNFLYAMQSHLQLNGESSLLAVTTLSFDIAVLELFLPLLTGGRILLASREQASDPLALRELLNETKPSLMQATPGTWRMLVDANWTGSRKLKALIGGEKVTREIADALLDRAAAVWNCYGPTETTVWSTVCRLERDGLPISIGRPLANTTLYVLDERQQVVPIGAKGELYIGGEGLARGYRNRPDLTTERFIPNPFGPGRLYRTGDIVRFRQDGNLEILGRNDAQVKVRGFRIELGDVENALAACPEVSACAVVMRQDATGEDALAGYYVLRPGVERADVRRHLAQTLPPYMVPTFLTAMDALPMTPNGKIDRKALPAATEAPIEEITQPADTLEGTLTSIWESTLGVRPIHITDNFFELGGHSVLAARIFARMEKVLGKALPLATLFQAPTIEKLAEVIRKSDWKPMWSSLVPIRPAGTKPPFFFVHPIGGNVLNFSGFCSHFGPDQPIYGLQARGLNNEVAPHTSVEEMAADYIQNIRSVQPDGPYYIGGFSAGGVVAFEMARQLQDMAQPVGILALLDTEILTLTKEEVSLGERLHAWWRMTKVNLRYASRMSVGEYISKKAFNLRMRRKLFAWGVRERLGLTIDPTKLNAEEAFLLAFKRYVPQPFYGNATLFRAGDGAEYLDPKLGWAGLIRGYLDIQEVNGDHDTILQEPHIGMLARLLESCLERARGSDPHQTILPQPVPVNERMTGLILDGQEVIG